MKIDTFAYSNRWRTIHPAEKAVFALISLIAAMLARSPLAPLLIATVMTALTIAGARIPLSEYLRLILAPVFFLLWSCFALAVDFSGGEILLARLPLSDLAISLSRTGITQAELAFARALGGISSLMFLALTTPVTEIMALLRKIGTPKLLIELMTITYRQLFIFLEIAGQIKRAQEARLGYGSTSMTMKSLGSMAGNILLRSISRARQNHLGLLARGYDSELLFLSPEKSCSTINLIGAVGAGCLFLALALTVKP